MLAILRNSHKSTFHFFCDFLPIFCLGFCHFFLTLFLFLSCVWLAHSVYSSFFRAKIQIEYNFLQGETPYSIDQNSQKPIIGQIFGTRRLNANEDGAVMLGYDLYSSALANILTEPQIAMPITGTVFFLKYI